MPRRYTFDRVLVQQVRYSTLAESEGEALEQLAQGRARSDLVGPCASIIVPAQDEVSKLTTVATVDKSGCPVWRETGTR